MSAFLKYSEIPIVKRISSSFMLRNLIEVQIQVDGEKECFICIDKQPEYAIMTYQKYDSICKDPNSHICSSNIIPITKAMRNWSHSKMEIHDHGMIVITSYGVFKYVIMDKLFYEKNIAGNKKKFNPHSSFKTALDELDNDESKYLNKYESKYCTHCNKEVAKYHNGNLVRAYIGFQVAFKHKEYIICDNCDKVV